MARAVNSELPKLINEMARSMALEFGEKGQRVYRDGLTVDTMKRLPLHIDGVAQRDSSLGHVYELRRRGSPRHRLFVVTKTPVGMKVFFRNSRMLVPLSETQKQPGGPFNRRVTKRYYFYARATVYEYGERVVIRRKSSDIKFMWTTRTARPWFQKGNLRPLRGPIMYTPKKEYKGRFRQEVRFYVRSFGTLRMNEQAKLYSRRAWYSSMKAVRTGMGGKV